LDAWVCNDFDRDGALDDASVWIVELEGDAGPHHARVETSDAAVSPPNVLSVFASPETRARISAARALTLAGLRCDLEVRILDGGAAPGFLIELQLSETSSSDYYRAAISVSGSSLLLSESGSTEAGVSPGVRSIGSLANGWAHFTIEMAFGPGQQLRVTYGGNTSILAPLNDLSVIPRSTSQILAVGASLYPGATGWAAEFDNVACFAIP
jgi:hypothetical protein